MRRYLGLAGRLCLYGVCGFITVFILANSYVTAFSRPLPFINAVRALDLGFIQPGLTASDRLAMQADTRFEGNYGTPVQIKIGENKVRIPVSQPVYRDGQWLARASTAHYLIEDEAKNGDIGDTIVYMTAGKTTVPSGRSAKVGGNISLDTKRDWRYFYRIDEVVSINKGDRYVLPNSQANKLYAIVLEADGSYTVVAASLTNVQSADQ